MVGDRSGRGMIGILSRVAGALVWSRFSRTKLLIFLARPNQQDLAAMRELMQSGKVTPVIGRRYRLSEIREALLYVQQGHARGKVVLVP